MSKRLYNEKEITSILQRASVLSPNVSDEARVGLTLDELRQIGMDSGLDPEAVAAAAAELEAGSTTKQPSGFFGGPLTHTSTIVLDHEISDEAWEDMLVPIRRSYGKPGIVQTRALVHEWVTSNNRDSATGHVSATTRNGKTKIQVFWSDRTSAIPFYIPTFIGASISLPILFDELSMGITGFPVFLAIVALLFMASRLGVNVRGQKGVRKTERLAEELRAIASSRKQESTPVSRDEKSPAASSTLDVDVNVDDPEQPESHSTRRSRTR